MPLRSLVLDFNSYFASVEQQVRPELRGQPIAVAPVEADTTCCIAASKEAKGFGIRTGTPIGEARKLCPRLQVLLARPRLYVEFHDRLVAAIDACTPVDHVMSIDEVLCELTGKRQQPGEALALGKRIKERIRRDVGECLTSSIGIAPNPLLAKLASDLQKPDGLTVLDVADLPNRLKDLPVRTLCGIGPRMEARLHAHGLRTLGEVRTLSREAARQVWGSVEGERVHLQLQGEWVPGAPTRSRVLGHSRVLPPELRYREAAISVLHELTQKAAARLRRNEWLTTRLSVAVKTVRRHKWGQEVKLLETSDTLQLLGALEKALQFLPELPAPLLWVGVSFSGLVMPDNYTPCLFEHHSRRDALNAAVDRLNETFGKHTVFYGGAFQGRRTDAMRIAFQRIPELEKEREG
jgi:DNA polymerase-4